MAITNGYATLVQIKARLGITGSGEDTLLEEAVQSASREIDKYCGRRFYADSTATARTYYPDNACRVTTEDFHTTTDFVLKVDEGDDGTYETTIASTDYQLRPLSGIVDGESGWPYSKIELVESYRFLVRSRRPPVQVTAKWGWAAVPDPVYQACLIMATANFKLKDSAFGSVGIGELGIITVRQTPAAMAKLAPYRISPVLVG